MKPLPPLPPAGSSKEIKDEWIENIWNLYEEWRKQMTLYVMARECLQTAMFTVTITTRWHQHKLWHSYHSISPLITNMAISVTISVCSYLTHPVSAIATKPRKKLIASKHTPILWHGGEDVMWVRPLGMITSYSSLC